MSLKDDLGNTPTTQKDRLGALVELLNRSGIDPDEIGRVERIKVWQGFMKDDQGNPKIVDMTGVVLSPEWENGPSYPVVQQAAPTVIKPVKINEVTSTKRVTVILPDPQIGYRRLDNGEMIPCHDERAIDVALQILRAAKADHVVNLGDLIDFPEWSSKFLVLPEFVLTTQPSIDYAHRFLAKQRAIAPNAKMSLLGGNHDDRMGKMIAKNAMAALRLRRAEAPKEWAVLSIPFLLRLDELGIEYTGSYPAGRIRLTTGNDQITPLYAIHGEKLDVQKVANAERMSFVQGHIHRISFAGATYNINDRSETVYAFSPGCLCRIDGAVPSTKGGTDETGRPYQRYESWQQGVAIVTEDETGFWSPEIVPIHDGRAVWRGKTYLANETEQA